MDVKNIDVEKFTISHLLNSEESWVYKIPRYQREYKWKVREWEALYDDLNDNAPGHFLGSIIYITRSNTISEHTYEVVDGQQRLTTISLFFAALYAELEPYLGQLDDDQKHDVNILKRRLVSKDSKKAVRLVPQRQKQNQADYMGLLSELGIAQSEKSPKNAGNRRIYKAYNYFRKRIHELCKTASDPVAQIFEINEKLTKALIVAISVPSQSDAYKLFESLNNRGTPLTSIDLIKNMLLACVDDENGDVDECFNEWTNILDLIGDDDAVQERFFRQNYNAFRRQLNLPFVKDERAYPLGAIATKSTMLDIYEHLVKKSPTKFINELKQSAEAYSKILLVNTDGMSSGLRRSLLDLQRVQGAPSYILLLYLLKNQGALNITDGALIRTNDLLVKFFVRRNLTNTPPTMDLARLFMAFISTIETQSWEGERILKELKCKLIASTADDSAFEQALSGPVYEDNTDLVRFILCMLAQDGMTAESVDLWKRAPQSGQYIWTIEHIFPQGKNIPPCWVDMIANGDVEKAQEYRSEHVHKLGNLTITGYNSNLSNLSFQDKRDRVDKNGNPIGYKNGLNLNKDVCDKSEWTVDCITTRTKALANWIVRKFKLSD